jgi:hypothetical protein
MFLMVVGLVVAVGLLVERLWLGGCRVLRFEECFVGGTVGFGCRVEGMVDWVGFVDVFVVVDL